jgi:hypothetical protein
MRYYLLLTIISLLGKGALAQDRQKVQLVPLEEQQGIEVYMDGELFTVYRYDKELEKAILYPVFAPGGLVLTRGYPLETRAKERIDHPHHVGLWFNFGDVNGMDFWNNSRAVPLERKKNYGRIVHRHILKAESGKKGLLEVELDWMAPDNEASEKVLAEHTTHIFQVREDIFMLDRHTRLTAAADQVVLTDNKEGMLAIRVDRAFEHPSESPVLLSDESGRPAEQKVVDNEGVTGWYLNSEGDEGSEAWGKNARWVSLSGVKDGQSCTMVLMDHPGNLNYPACWHARGYGLFSINNLGRKVYNKKLERFQLVLKKGESLTFRHRFVSARGKLNNKQIEELFEDFLTE